MFRDILYLLNQHFVDDKKNCVLTSELLEVTLTDNMSESTVIFTSIFDSSIHISQLEDYCSSNIMIEGVPWIINFKKKFIRNEEWLGVYLYCKKYDELRDWTIAARLTIRSMNLHGQSIERVSLPYFFDCINTGFGVTDFLKWRELGDTFNFNIKIEVANQNSRDISKLVNFNKCGDESHQLALQLTIDKIHNLMAVRTSKFRLQNFCWELSIFKHSNKGLGLHLLGKNGTKETACNINIEFKMTSSIDGVRDMVKSREYHHNPSSFIMYPISWNELLEKDNGFIVNNSVSFEVKMKVKIN